MDALLDRYKKAGDKANYAAQFKKKKNLTEEANLTRKDCFEPIYVEIIKVS